MKRILARPSSEYISRAPFSLERMSFNQDSKTVVYRGEHFHRRILKHLDIMGRPQTSA